MINMTAVAFAPGHISAFFEPIIYQQDITRSGSRGAGFSITFGAISQVTAQQSTSQRIDTYINNKKTNAIVSKLAIQHLMGNTPLHITIHTTIHLPIGQGFGMSGTGALSSTLALAHLLRLPREHALRAAHQAEVEAHTGLGDVIASSFGGIEIRREAGLPPWGIIEHIPGTFEVVLCIIGSKIQTKTILTDPKRVNEIASYGRYCTKKLLEKPSIENLFTLAQTFTKKTGLADAKVREAIEAANTVGMASMCMLGNSLFAMGNTVDLCKILAPYGKLYVSTIDECGARLVNTQ